MVLLGSGLEMGHPDQGPPLFTHFAMQKTVKLAHLLSPSPVLLWHVPARIFLFKADGSWIFRLANGFFFFFSKESLATGTQNLRKPDSRSICTAHRMRSHCCPGRNQHCCKSPESLLILARPKSFATKFAQHADVDQVHRLAAISSALPVLRELRDLKS